MQTAQDRSTSSCDDALRSRLRGFVLVGDNRTRLAAEIACTVATDWTTRELDQIHIVEQTGQPVIRNIRRRAQGPVQLGARERQPRFYVPRGEIVAQHFDHQRDVASALT